MGQGGSPGVAGLMEGIFLVLSLLPFLMGWFSYDYLFPGKITDLVIMYWSMTLVRSRSREEGRLRIRRQYPAGGIFVIIVTITRVLESGML